MRFAPLAAFAVALPLFGLVAVHIVSLHPVPWRRRLAASLQPSVAPTHGPTPPTTTQSPSVSPTVQTYPPINQSPTSPSYDTIESRVNSQQACYTQGEGLNCNWNVQFLQDTGFDYGCEPSTVYGFPPTASPTLTSSVALCAERNPCTFTSGDGAYCMFSNSSTCEPQPMETLVARTIAVLNSAPRVRDAIQLPAVCANLLTNVSCTAPCQWIPSANNPSRLGDAAASSGNGTLEVQVLNISSTANTSTPDVFVLNVNPPEFDATAVTLTTQVDPPLVITGGGFFVNDTAAKRTSGLVPWNATTVQLLAALVKGLGLDAALTQVFADPALATGQRSWVVACANASQAAKLSATSAKLVAHGNVAATWSHGTPQVMLTLHKRNVHVVSLVAPASLVAGSFRLQYFWPGCAPGVSLCGYLNSQSFTRYSSYVTTALAFNASALDVQTALAQSASANGNGPAYVAVVLVDNATALAWLSSTLNATVQRAWRVTFATTVARFELAEFPLAVQTECAVGCSALVTKNGSLATARVDVRYSAPVVAGSVGALQPCLLGEQLPGLYRTRANDTTVFGSYGASAAAGDWIRLGASYYQVQSAASTGNGTQTVELDRPYFGPPQPDDKGLDSQVGIRAYLCVPQATDVLDLGAAGATVADALKAALQKIPTPFNLNTRSVAVDAAALSTNAQLGTVQWNVSVWCSDGTLPALVVVPAATDQFALWPQTTLWGQQGASVDVTRVRTGTAPASGFFQLAFAGYGGSDLNYTELSTLAFIDFPFVATGGRLPDSLPYTLVLSVSPPPSASALQSALDALANVGTVQVTAAAAGVYYISFLPDASSALGANVPQLYVVSEASIQGTGAMVAVTTAVDGPANVLPGSRNGTQQQIEVAVNPQASPCSAVDVAGRLASLVSSSDGGQVATQLANLNTQFAWCAQAQTRDDCVGTNAATLNCAWRGAELATLVGDNNNTLVDERFVWLQARNVTQAAPWGMYGGNTSQSVWANCTVEYYTLTSGLLELLALVDNATFQTALQPVQGLADAFGRCGQNPAVEVEAYGQAQFVDAWQEIVTTTCYTCMFAYGVAGGLLAARMDKFKLWGFSFTETLSGVGIVLFSVTFGGVYAFLIAAIPSALITQMYASIPVRVEQSWATSLGVAQGIMIVYFDLGRSTTPIEKL